MGTSHAVNLFLFFSFSSKKKIPAHKAQAHLGPLVQEIFDETLYPESEQSKPKNKAKIISVNFS